MDEAQFLRRLKNVLRARRYGGDSSAARVFPNGSVRVSAGPKEDAIDRLVLPAALIRPGVAVRDPNGGGQGNVYRYAFAVVITVGIPGDEFGETAMLGGFEVNGLAQVQREVLAEIQQLGPKDGVYVSHMGSGWPEAAPDTRANYILARELRFDALISGQAVFQRPASLVSSVAGGVVTLTWTAPEDDTDLVAYVVRRTSGDIPAARPDEGTSIALGSPLDLTVNNSPGAGTWTYAVFARYAAAGQSVALHSSDHIEQKVTI